MAKQDDDLRDLRMLAETYSKAIELGTGRAYACVLRGSAHLELGLHQEAEEDFSASIESDWE